MWTEYFFAPFTRNSSLALSKVAGWLNKPKWLNRLMLYFLILLPAVYAVFDYVLSYFGLLHTQVDSARFMLSTLVQSEATIVALVVTLSLIVMQLAASSYSARVIDVFRRTPDLWILIGIYSFAIFYGLGVLKLVGAANTSSDLETHISSAYYLGFFAFVALVPYILNTLEMLRPSTVINMLAQRITRQKVLSAAEKSAEDPILPIVDMVNGALIKYDNETVIEGLTAIGARTSSIFKELKYAGGIFKSWGYGTSEEIRLSENIFDHLSSVGKLAISMNNEKAVVATLFSLWANVQAAEEQKLGLTMRWGIESIEELGVTAAHQKLGLAALTAVQLTGSVGETAASQNLSDLADDALEALEEIRAAAVEHGLDDAIQQAEAFTERINEALSK